MRLRTVVYEHCKRVCTESELWEETPLLHRARFEKIKCACVCVCVWVCVCVCACVRVCVHCCTLLLLWWWWQWLLLLFRMLLFLWLCFHCWNCCSSYARLYPDYDTVVGGGGGSGGIVTVVGSVIAVLLLLLFCCLRSRHLHKSITAHGQTVWSLSLFWLSHCSGHK